MASAMFLSDHDCPVCHEEFTEPKLLQCNHRVCKKCLLSWLQAEGEGGCPVCRAPIHHESGKQKAKSADVTSLVDDLPTDLVTMAIVESHKALSGSDECGLCDFSVAATSFCLNCKVKVCNSCLKIHQKIPSSRDHVVEDLGKLTSQRVVASHNASCDLHPAKPAELYCWHHHMLVCLLCAVSKHKECGGRGVEGVGDVAKRERPALRDQTNRLRQLEHDIDQQTARLEQEICDAQAHFKPLKTDTMATFDRLHKTLDTRLKEMMAAIESQEDKVVKEKKAEKQALDQQRSAVVSQVRILDQMLDSSHDSALVGMLHKLKARLDELENQPRPERASSERGLSKVVFDSEKLATLEREIAGLGQVTEDKAEHRCKCGAVISSEVKLCGKCDKPAVQPDTQILGRRVKHLDTTAPLDELENQPRPDRASSRRGLSKVVFNSQKEATLERDIAGMGQVTVDIAEHRCKCGAVISSEMKLCGNCDKPDVQPDTQIVGRHVKHLDTTVTEDNPKHRCTCGAVISSEVKLCGNCDKPAVQPDTQFVSRRVKHLDTTLQKFWGVGTIIRKGTGRGQHGDGWVKVKWDVGGVRWWRMGADGVYTVNFV